MKMQKKEVEKLLGLKKSYIDYLIREKWVLPQKKGQFYNFSEEDRKNKIIEGFKKPTCFRKRCKKME